MFEDQDTKKTAPGNDGVEDIFSDVDGGVPANLPVAPGQNDAAEEAAPSATLDAPNAALADNTAAPAAAPGSLEAPRQAASQAPSYTPGSGLGEAPAPSGTPLPPPAHDMLNADSRSSSRGGGVGKVIGVLTIVIVAIALVAGAVYFALQYIAQMQIEEGDVSDLPVLNIDTTDEEDSQDPVDSGAIDFIPSDDSADEPSVEDSDEEFPSNEDPDIVAEVEVDTDGDGLSDAEEDRLGTDPTLTDTDADGLSDFDEVRTYGTDPLNQDTDADGFVDGVEVINGYDPAGEGRLFQPLPPR